MSGERSSPPVGPVTTPPRKPGRPSRFTPEVATELVRLVDRGWTRKAAAAHLGLGERTLYDWLALGQAGHPTFAAWSEALEEAAEVARLQRVRRYWERYAVQAKARWQAFKRQRERWWLDQLGPEEFYRRRLIWLAQHRRWGAFRRLMAAWPTEGFRSFEAP